MKVRKSFPFVVGGVTPAARVLAAVLFSLGAGAAGAVDSFDSASNLLTLDAVVMNGATYRNVAATVNSYALLSVGGGAAGQDSFDPVSNTLVLGTVAYQGTTYTNVTVKINSYTLLSVAGATTAGTVATSNYTGEVAGYLAALNNYRTQCGIPALSQNTVLDGAAQTLGTVGQTYAINLATSAGYAVPGTAGGVAGTYWSNSANKTLVGQYELQTAMMSYGAMLNLMRPYTDVGMFTTLDKAGSVNQRGARVMLGNPVSRNIPSPLTFPCANTSDIAPYWSGSGGSFDYVSLAAGALSSDYTLVPTGSQGTPIAVFANPGDTLVLTAATVTAQGGAGVPVVLETGGRAIYTYEGAVWPQQNLMPNTAYDVVIVGTVNGVAFSKRFTFRTGGATPLYLP